MAAAQFELSHKLGNMQSSQSSSFICGQYKLSLICHSFCQERSRKIASFTVKQSFSRLHRMLKDAMSKDSRKMSPMDVTLKAGAITPVGGFLQALGL